MMESADPQQTIPASAPASNGWRYVVRARWVLLAAYALLSGAWYVVFFSKADPLGLSIRPGPSQLTWAEGTLVLLAPQYLLLLGAPSLSWPRPRPRRPIVVSLLAGSAIAVVLSAGIVLAGVSLYQLLFDPASFGSMSVSAAPTTAPAATGSASLDPGVDVPWRLVGALLAGWAVWLVVFALLGRGGPQQRRFGRMYRTLIAGTVLELLITIPIDAQVRRRTECYCGEGTFFALAAGLTAACWTFGPGVALLFVLRRHQRRLARGCCIQCGYNLRGLRSDRCPECGANVSPRAVAPA